jgi:sulfur carrier protein ThiS
MKVRVNLYGTLSARIPGYRQSQGIEIELPEGATVNDLLALLEISESQKAVVAIDGRIRKTSGKIPCGASAQVLQPIHGG